MDFPYIHIYIYTYIYTYIYNTDVFYFGWNRTLSKPIYKPNDNVTSVKEHVCYISPKLLLMLGRLPTKQQILLNVGIFLYPDT